MEYKLYDVDEVAQILHLHPKTVRRFIREGKLNARKIGRAWSISSNDLREFAHGECVDVQIEPSRKSPLPTGDRITVSTVIELAETDPEESSRISNALIALLNCKEPSWGQTRYDFMYTPETGKARFILYGSPLFISEILQVLENVTGSEK